MIKQRKFNNLIAFLDLLFCITMTYVALFVLSVIQIKQIKVTVTEHQALKDQYTSVVEEKLQLEDLRSLDQQAIEQLQAKLEQNDKEQETLQANLKSTKQELDSKEQMLNAALEETKTAQERAEELASETQDLEEEIAKLRGMGNWRTNAKIAIEVVWPKKAARDDDIDIYVQSPNKHVAYFADQAGPGLFIDRDDLGNMEMQQSTHNEVVQFFRLLDTSEAPYLVNLRVYDKVTTQPTPVIFKLYEVTETDAKVVFEETYDMSFKGQLLPVIEIFTKPAGPNSDSFVYSHFEETETKIRLVRDLDKNSQEERPVRSPTQTIPLTRPQPTLELGEEERAVDTKTVTIKPEDQDPRFIIDQQPPTYGGSGGNTSTSEEENEGDGSIPDEYLDVIPNKSTKE